MVVFDTGVLPRPTRVAAAIAAFRAQSFPVGLEFEPGEVAVHLQTWAYGEVSAFRMRMSGHRLTRRARDIRRGEVGTLSFGVQTSGIACWEQAGTRQRLEPGRLVVIDQDVPYEFGWSGAGSGRSMRVPAEVLDLAPGELPGLRPRLPHSPLYPLLCRHIAALALPSDSLADPEAADAVGEASIRLARALIDSVRDTRAPDALLRRAVGFARLHLTDPALSVERIAAHLGITGADLRRIARDERLDLDRWLLTERLHRARQALAAPQTRPFRAEYARRWGFADSARFTGEFRAAYGLSPAAWQRAARSGGH